MSAALKTGFMAATAAVERSISHNERAVLVLREDIGPTYTMSDGLEDLMPLGLEDYATENDGTVDAWGTHDGHEWRVLLVDGICHDDTCPIHGV